MNIRIQVFTLLIDFSNDFAFKWKISKYSIGKTIAVIRTQNIIWTTQVEVDVLKYV